jgi:hypothetical protein
LHILVLIGVVLQNKKNKQTKTINETSKQIDLNLTSKTNVVHNTVPYYYEDLFRLHNKYMMPGFWRRA